MNKRLKLPNGYGSITMRNTSRLRKPYIVRVTIDGKQHAIGYTATYEEGLSMLASYHHNPIGYFSTDMTFRIVYDLMSKERFRDLAPVTIANYTSAFNHCCAIWDKEFISLRPTDLQSVIDAAGAHAVQRKVRQIFHHCYKYALKYELCRIDYSQYVDIAKHIVKKPKKPFVTRQINRIKVLASNGDVWAMAVLMLIYSGCRTSEFLSVSKSDVKLKQRYFVVRDSKTEAGRNRPVPISKKTLPYFERWMQLPGKTLIANDGTQMTYRAFRKKFDTVMADSRCHHTPHECRHTLATMLNNAGANVTATKRILGHAGSGVTEKVYTHKSLHELKKAIDLI